MREMLKMAFDNGAQQALEDAGLWQPLVKEADFRSDFGRLANSMVRGGTKFKNIFRSIGDPARAAGNAGNAARSEATYANQARRAQAELAKTQAGVADVVRTNNIEAGATYLASNANELARLSKRGVGGIHVQAAGQPPKARVRNQKQNQGGQQRQQQGGQQGQQQGGQQRQQQGGQQGQQQGGQRGQPQGGQQGQPQGGQRGQGQNQKQNQGGQQGKGRKPRGPAGQPLAGATPVGQPPGTIGNVKDSLSAFAKQSPLTAAAIVGGGGYMMGGGQPSGPPVVNHY